MEMYALSEKAREFGGFGEEHVFQESAKPIMEAFEKAVVVATRSARNAIRFGHAEQIREAQWDEAVASTLANCVVYFEINEIGGREIYLPDKPNFE